MSDLVLIYKTPRETDRWFTGDRWLRPPIRRLIRGAPIPSGIDKVFLNLTAGLREIGQPFRVNPPWNEIRRTDRVGVLGRDRACLAGYDLPNPLLAGVALMTHPSEWPTLCSDYPVARYVQHCEWAINFYRPYFGVERCAIWPVGIDTNRWTPIPSSEKTTDFLLYNKIRWDHSTREHTLVQPIRETLLEAGCTFEEIRYGHYRPDQYAAALRRCRALLFICEHESQGIAYQEALSANLPVLAWNPGEWLDPNRFRWASPHVPATSVPYFDERCGETFESFASFPQTLHRFLDSLNLQYFRPRDYILENLTLAKSARHYLKLLPN